MVFLLKVIKKIKKIKERYLYNNWYNYILMGLVWYENNF